MIATAPSLRQRFSGRRLVPLLAAAGFLAYALSEPSPYGLRLMTIGGIYALLVVGYQFIFGHAGALSLAQGTFFGLGAYVTGILAGNFAVGFLATFPLSLLAPVALAALVAAPVLRLQSHYFALATLGVAQVVLLIAVNWQEVTGGANGLPGVPGIAVLGWAVPRGWPLFAVVWSAVVVAALLAHRLTRSAWGQAFRVLRETPLEAAAIGLDGGAMRLAAFLLSALYAGGAGAFYAHTIGVVSPDALGFPVMVTCLTMAMVGGRTSIIGGIVGAALLVHLPEWLRFLGNAYLLAYGAALLAVIVVCPEGVLGAWERLRLGQVLRTPQAPPGEPSCDEWAANKSAERQAMSPRPPPAVLEFGGVAKRFGGVTALAGVDLRLTSGEILGLIGPNGSGKTTLVNLAAGFDRLDTGTIRLDGTMLDGLAPYAIARRGLARNLQTGALIDTMSALDTVALSYLSGRGMITLRRALAGDAASVAAAHGPALTLLSRLGVAAAAATQRCGALAHGVRRRVEIARALALGPRLLLLDEPAAGLDRAARDVLARTLAALAETGIGLLVIEHDMRFLMTLAHRVVCLERGRIIAAGTPPEIGRNPQVIAAYLGGSDANGEPKNPQPQHH
jgi:branched-chain amino acid transport system permease protein